MNQQCYVTHVVVGTIAAVALIYTLTLAVCAVFAVDANEVIMSQFKDIGLVAIGAIASILARTRPDSDKPAEVHVTNQPSDPVPVDPKA